MSRLPYLRRDELSPDGQQLWDGLVGRLGGHLIGENGGLTGPFNAMVTAADTGKYISSLGAKVRFGTSIERRLSEIAIITVGARWQAEFEWWAHAAMAREHGVADAAVDAIARGEDPGFTAADERAVYEAAHELGHTGRLGRDAYDAAHRFLGDVGMVELVSLCGYYTLISFLLNAFDVPLPSGVSPVWQVTLRDLCNVWPVSRQVQGMDDPEIRFRAVFELAYAPLCRYARYRGLTGPDAEDLVAQTMEIAWRRISDVPETEPLPWLYAVAHNLWRNMTRRERRRRELLTRFRILPANDPGGHESGVLLAALASLSDSDQEVLRLVACDGLAPAEVAIVLGCSPAAARTRLHRARTRLAAVLRVGADMRSLNQPARAQGNRLNAVKVP